MPITDYKGKQLLDQSIADEIQKESDLIVRNKDVSQAWQASSHLKEQISSLPQQEIAPVLGKYRGITTKLKALALPLLSQEDVEHLLKNNLEFLDTTSEKFLSEGLIAWLASQEDENQESLKKKLSSVIDKTSAFAPKILEILRTASPPAKEGIEGRLYGSRIDKVTPSSSTGGERQTQDGTESVARQIFSQAGAKQTEEVFVRRAKALVESRMHDVRTKVDISEYLSRPFQTGGLGLAGEALQNSE
ncbi:hypothetical protein KKF64_02620, partial [Patescibacteria group bacterium]|nr:hypothetical protein [Patescibacteria group bacterium]